MDKVRSSTLPSQAWLDAIAESEAALAAGQVVEIDIGELCQEIEAQADAMDTAQRTKRPASV